jgi:hypothetical protein
MTTARIEGLLGVIKTSEVLSNIDPPIVFLFGLPASGKAEGSKAESYVQYTICIVCLQIFLLLTVLKLYGCGSCDTLFLPFYQGRII